MNAKEMVTKLATILDDKKGKDILLLETQDVTSLADYFILCTGTSAPHLKALADSCELAMKELGAPPHHIEGRRGGTWVLQDYADVVLHLFSEEAREFYALDHLWADARTVELQTLMEE